jgi:peptidoglycan/LPS O-acetylase OafA/YrhL
MNPTLLTQRVTSGDRKVIRRIASLMAFEAITLAIAATLHLSGHVHGRSQPFNPDRAGIAEAMIGIALAAGAIAMASAPSKARTIGLVLNGLATVGFLNGLTMTARGGDLPDIAYHLVVLPVLIASFIVLLRAKDLTKAEGESGGDARGGGSP